ncbi:endolytic transglycosylase MltG [Sphingomonas colocasiae]|uniref:Endolytic murein transglycosylase n=1 Tax=Sphingomonas colocasiae TaxID=1848973 RepID=A0ABS7PLX0_9SPHN|nr:endolytic transglycosylase MltG [Sphingomonas colocasiae]MBY8821462.1 endolytic transglycosylase MltG [Sphingomonas colocasiae]
MRKAGCLGLIVAAALGLSALYVLRTWGGPGPAEQNMTVVIKDGSSLTGAARTLEQAGAIRSADLFLTFAKLLGDDAPIQSGEYRIPKGMSASDVLKMLQGGKTLQRFVTVPEGMPSILVHEKLMAEKLLTGTVEIPAEGSVLPDSYSFERGEPRAAVLKRMQAAMTKKLDALWAARKPTSAVSSPREAIILASIVEKETGVPSERRMVASVYSNRLRTGMKLQADPTVIYPVTKGKPLGRRILRSELNAQNGYNTYAMAGLPAGPIANPGAESIAAVLDPEQSRALYFVADGSGGHVFAETLSQHNANVQKWYALRRAKGEM